MPWYWEKENEIRFNDYREWFYFWVYLQPGKPSCRKANEEIKAFEPASPDKAKEPKRQSVGTQEVYGVCEGAAGGAVWSKLELVGLYA